MLNSGLGYQLLCLVWKGEESVWPDQLTWIKPVPGHNGLAFSMMLVIDQSTGIRLPMAASIAVSVSIPETQPWLPDASAPDLATALCKVEQAAKPQLFAVETQYFPLQTLCLVGLLSRPLVLAFAVQRVLALKQLIALLEYFFCPQLNTNPGSVFLLMCIFRFLILLLLYGGQAASEEPNVIWTSSVIVF